MEHPGLVSVQWNIQVWYRYKLSHSCSPSSISSYSRGGKSAGRHRQGSPLLPASPCTISLFFLWLPNSATITETSDSHIGEIGCFVLELLVGRGDPSRPLHPAGDE